MGLFDEIFGGKDSIKSRGNTNSNKRNDIVLLSKRPLHSTTRSTRPFSSASSIRSHNSNKTTSNESVSISKYGNTGSKSAPSISSRVKTNNILSSKKPDIKTENNKRWSALSQPKKPAVSKEQINSSSKYTTSLHYNNNNNNNEGKIYGRLKKPIESSNLESKRGQAQASSKSEQGQLQGQIREDLSRSSSVTNLNTDHKNKGAFSKLKKSASKDRLDKISDKKHERKGISSNNNKLDSGEVDHSLESLQEIELLQRQLTDMAKEKSELALELGERKGELQILKNEIVKLKMFQEQSNVRIEQLNDENTSLRNRLRDVAHSPLSDNEKQQLLLESHRHSSAPASIATNVSLLEEGNVGDITACPTPDWDKHSSSNVSEVSVACLQDKINQMQETHYSTNEELQATLQELTDLQRQLTELQQDNERLLDEKNLMFDSLCRQTERLNDARAEVESLKQLLYRDKDETGQFESIVDREQKLVDLLKSAQEERENLLVKQEQLSNELQDARAANIEQIAEIEQLTERVRTLESTLDAKHAEHRQLDQELAIAKDQCSGRQIEINRLTDLLENARTKINELEQERALNDKSELDELLDNARKEKDALESEVANLKEQVARSRNETEKLKEQVSILQEECKVTRNNAKCTQSELEYKCEKLIADKANLNDQLQQYQEAANELQVQAQCQLEDKRQLSAVLSETQRNLSDAERKNTELSNEVEELKRLRKEENEEWEKFQNDLLTSVRVANDFKSEAQQELQKMIMENKTHRERVRQLEAQIDKLKGHPTNDEQQTTPNTSSAAPLYHPVAISSSLKHSQNLELGNNDTVTNNTKQRSIQVVDSARTSQTGSEMNSLCLPLTSVVPCATGNLKSDTSKKIPESIEKAPPISEKDNTKKSKFLPVLSIISRNKNNNPDTKKEQDSSSGRHSENSEDSTGRYGDSSKVINLSRVPDYSEKENTTVKKRKPNKNAVKYSEKRLSDQEERDLEILDNLYSQIDHKLPEEYLTTHQKYILKVKDTFDNDNGNPKLKPVAKQPKDKLAISKPLLTSVLNNPRLKEITEDKNMVDVENEDIEGETAVSREFKRFVSNDPNFSKRYEMVLNPENKFDDIFHKNLEFNYYNYEDRRKSVTSFKPESSFVKSKSLDDIHYRDSMSYEDSNDLSVAGGNIINSESKPDDIKYSENVNFENLETLYAKIDLSKPDDQFTNEEKFVMKLKQSLDEMGRKNTLRKMAKKQKKLKISQPTELSILTNPKLMSIINDPNIRTVDEASGESSGNSIQTGETENADTRSKLTHKRSMSYDDINLLNFKIPRAKLVSRTSNKDSSSSDKSEEFNNKIGRYKKNRQVEMKSAPFSRVKRSYDLQIMRHPNDKRKMSFNDIELDSEAICILERYTNFENFDIQESQRNSLQAETLEVREMEEPEVSNLKIEDSQRNSVEPDRRKIKENEETVEQLDFEEKIKKLEEKPEISDFKIRDPEELESNELEVSNLKIEAPQRNLSLTENFHTEEVDDIDTSKSPFERDAFRRSFIETKTIDIKKTEELPKKTFISTKQLEITETANPILIKNESKELPMMFTKVEDCYYTSTMKTEGQEIKIFKETDITSDTQLGVDPSYTEVENVEPKQSNVWLKNEDPQPLCLETNKSIQDEFSKLDFVIQTTSNKEGVTDDETTHSQSTENTNKFSTLEDSNLLIEDTDLDFGSVITRKPPHHISESNSEDEEILSSLKSKLDEDEFELLQRIQSNPEFKRPNSGLNEEDLKLIEFAQRQCSQEPNDEDNFENLKMKIEPSSAIEDFLSSSNLSPAKDDDWDNQDTSVNFLRNSKIRSSLNEPIYMNYSSFLNKMIHEDAESSSKVRKQPLPLPRSKSINEGTVNDIEKNKDVDDIDNIETDGFSQNFDSSSNDISKITSDISDLTKNLEDFEEQLDIRQDMIADNDQTDIKIFGNVGKYFALHSAPIDDENATEHENTAPSECMSVLNDKASGNIEKLKDIESTKSQKAVEGKKKHKRSKRHQREKTKFNVEDDGKPAEKHESDKSLTSFCSYRSEDITEKNPVSIKTFKEVIIKDDLETIKENESKKSPTFTLTSENLEVIKETEDNVNSEATKNDGKNLGIFKDECISTKTQMTKEEATHVDISRELAREEATSTNINSEKIKFENENKEETNDRESPTDGGFSIKTIINKLGSYITGSTSPTPTTTTTYVNTGFVENRESPIHNTGFIKDIPAEDVARGTADFKDSTMQTAEPVVVEHHFRGRNTTERCYFQDNKPNYDTLERISFFHVLNNPPKSYPHSHHHHIPTPLEDDSPKCLVHGVHPAANQNLFNLPKRESMENFKISSTRSSFQSSANRSSIEYAIRRFEDMIQSTQQHTQQQPCLQFKSDIMKKATSMALRKLNNEQSNMPTDIQNKSQTPNENNDVKKENTSFEEPNNQDKKNDEFNLQFQF